LLVVWPNTNWASACRPITNHIARDNRSSSIETESICRLKGVDQIEIVFAGHTRYPNRFNHCRKLLAAALIEQFF